MQARALVGRCFKSLILILCMTFWAVTLSAQSLLDEERSSSESIKIAALSYLGDETTRQEWQPTISWLANDLPQYKFEFIPAEHDDIIELVKNGRVDYVLTNPGLYSFLHYEYGINHMLSQVHANDNISPLSLGSTLIKRKDNHEIQRFQDLPGHSMAVVSMETFGGYQVMLRELRSRQINPEVDMQVLQVDFPMSNVLEAVASGAADTGVIRACVLETIPNWQAQFTVIEPAESSDFPCLVSTRLYPGWVFSGINNDRLIETRDIMLSLLQLPPYETRSGEMHWSVLSNTQGLYDLFKELEIGLYGPTSPSLLDYFKRYWWVLAVILLLVMMWALYTARVRYLVRIRTADLELALAQQKALQDKINEVQEQANHQAKLVILGEMSGTLAHELNQPLATIGNYSRSILRRLQNNRLSQEDTRLAAQEITEQTERASSIIKGVRAFARKRPMQVERANIKEVCEGAVSLFSGMLSQPPQVQFYDYLGGDRVLSVDPVQIQQALINLLKNAYDAMNEAASQPQMIQLILWAADNDKQVNITVQDSGPGLSAEAYEHLFETFYTSKIEGLGLGLSVCRTIAEAHGGRLEATPVAESLPVKALAGASFTLSLPA